MIKPGRCYKIGLAYRMGDRLGAGTYEPDDSTGMLVRVIAARPPGLVSPAGEWSCTTDTHGDSDEPTVWFFEHRLQNSLDLGLPIKSLV